MQVRTQRRARAGAGKGPRAGRPAPHLAQLQALANASDSVQRQRAIQLLADGRAVQRAEHDDDRDYADANANANDHDDQLQPMQRAAEEEELMQGKASPGAGPQPASGVAARGGLPPNLKSGIESLSGVSMDGVRVHRNSDRPAQVDALAYALGRDIHLGPGQERHLPHEAWHVVQQAQGRVRPTTEANGMAINDDARLEKDADVMGARAMEAAAKATPEGANSGR